MSETLTIPYLDKQVSWRNVDTTYIIGSNGSGKTLLLNLMMCWCEEKGYSYIHYNAITALDEFHDLVQHSSNNDIKYACKVMGEVAIDFQDDITRWLVAYDEAPVITEDTPADLLREILMRCGSGYSRMFVMTIKAIANPLADYYFLDLPETSLHIQLSRQISSYLLHNCRYTKLVLASHSPEVLGDRYGLKNKEVEVLHLNKDENGEIIS